MHLGLVPRRSSRPSPDESRSLHWLAHAVLLRLESGVVLRLSGRLTVLVLRAWERHKPRHESGVREITGPVHVLLDQPGSELSREYSGQRE
jgi:hypothetical protein